MKNIVGEKIYEKMLCNHKNKIKVLIEDYKQVTSQCLELGTEVELGIHIFMISVNEDRPIEKKYKEINEEANNIENDLNLAIERCRDIINNKEDIIKSLDRRILCMENLKYIQNIKNEFDL